MKSYVAVTGIIRARRRHFASIAGWWWAALVVLFTLFLNANSAIEKWGPAACKAWWEAHTTPVLFGFGWQIWLIGVLCISVVVFFEGSYRRACKLIDASEQEKSALAEAHRTEIKKLISANCPQLVFQRWGQIPQDHPVAVSVPSTIAGQFLQRGIYLLNVGEMAHEIEVETFEIDDQLWASSSVVNGIEKRGQGFALVWLENQKGIGSSIVGRAKWDLEDAMRKAGQKKNGTEMFFSPDYSVPVSVTYRDSNNVRYRSRSDLTYIRSQTRLDFGPTKFEKCG